MKKKIKVPKVSVVIVNYNNEKYLEECIKSIFDQTYSNIEIIVVDNKSTDNSLKVLKKYKNNITLILNKKRTNQGSYNQINSYYKGYLKSKGKYLFFLDSDDYFKRNKIKFLIQKFKKNKKIDLIFDLPIFKFQNKKIKKKFIQKKFIFSSWPRFSPQSCISVRKTFAREIFQQLSIKKFETIWFDFRIAVYYFLKKKKLFIFKKHLTYYRQSDNSASKKYKTFSKNWWHRRKQAHNFVSYINKKLKKKDTMNIDKILTYIINLF